MKGEGALAESLLIYSSRLGVDEFLEALRVARFEVVAHTMEDNYRANPIVRSGAKGTVFNHIFHIQQQVGGTESDLELHFNELPSDNFRLFECNRPQ